MTASVHIRSLSDKVDD